MQLMKYKLSKIDAIDMIDNYRGRVYDIEVDSNHSYCVEQNKTIVHNCRTRVVTGVGYPQLSANMECSDAVKGLGGWIVADGGCSNSGDIAKALASSDGFVMIGSMLSAHTENTSIDNLVSRNDKMYAIVYGMSSETAMKTHYGEVAKYKSSEGATTEVPYRGKLQDTLDQIFGGLRSTLTYIGTTNLKHLNKRTTFIRVNQLHSGSYDKYKVGN